MSEMENVIGSVLKKDSLILRSVRQPGIDFKNTERHIGRKNGTTILAMHYKDGVVIAGDRRTTDYNTHTDDSIKIEETGNLTAIGFAGTVAFIQEAKEALALLLLRLESLVEIPIFVDGQAKLMKNILKANFDTYTEFMYFLQYYGVPILAGVNPESGEGMIFAFDEVGGFYPKSDYATTGSGGPRAEVILDRHWKVGMKEADAVELAVDALVIASADNYTSPPLMAPVTALAISKKGIRYLGEKKAQQMAFKFLIEELKRKGKTEQLKFFMGEE